MPSNQDMIDYWNGEAGATWTRLQDRLDALLRPVTQPALTALAAQPGEHVLDVGCGCGATSLAIADAGTRVTGVDVSAPMLALARRRAGRRGGLQFLESDAASVQLATPVDAIFSRFGVMFFDDPTAAFSNLHGQLNDRGRLAFVCWQSARSNPWLSIAGTVIAPLLPEPETPPDPKAPGPFAFADPDDVRCYLTAAGFGDVHLQEHAPSLRMAEDLDSAIALLSQVGPLSRALTELEGDRAAEAIDAVREALRPHFSDGVLSLGASVWVVTAQA